MVTMDDWGMGVSLVGVWGEQLKMGVWGGVTTDNGGRGGIPLVYEATQNSETFERNTQVLSSVYRRAGQISFLILHHCH